MSFLILVILLLPLFNGFVNAMQSMHQSVHHRPHVQHWKQQSERAYATSNYVEEAIHPNAVPNLTKLAVAYCHKIGFVSPYKQEPNDLAVVLPFGLLPSPFPEELFTQAMDTQPIVTELYYRVSQDFEFLLDAFKDLRKADEWIEKAVHLMEELEKEKNEQPKTLIFARTDYLTHQARPSDTISLKQVEVNVGQCGGAGYGQWVSELHQGMLDKVERMHFGKPPYVAQGRRPENRLTTNAAETLLHAWQSFADEFNDPTAFIVYLYDGQRGADFEDYRFMQFEVEELAKKKGLYVNVVLMAIKETPNRLQLKNDKHLYVDEDHRVGLVHMVAGYVLAHYNTDAEWATRFDIERSKAIVSPNIRAQLAGTKRVQQVLAEEKALERFFDPVGEKHKIDALRATFVRLYGLDVDGVHTEEFVQNAIQTPGNFVLKAQMGGGRGNFFGAEMAAKLNTMTPLERSAYTLMEKIRPIIVKNYMRRPFKESSLEEVNSELSVYGAYFGNGADFQPNAKVRQHTKAAPDFPRVDGYLVRSKLSTSDQGGLLAGHGFLDSLLLFKEKEFHQHEAAAAHSGTAD